MAHLIVKDLPDGLVQELRELAARRGQTMKACVSILIREAVWLDTHNLAEPKQLTYEMDE